jgi:hypothetical protein
MNTIRRGWPAAQCWVFILIANVLALFMGLAYSLVGALTWRGADSTIGYSARPMAAEEHGVASMVGDSVGAWLVHRLLQESGEPLFALLMLLVALLSGLVVLLGVLQARARHAERTVLRQLAAAREQCAQNEPHDQGGIRFADTSERLERVFRTDGDFG